MLRCLLGALYVDMRLFGGLEACLGIKSDGLTKEDKAQNKNAETANENDVYPLPCLSVFYEQLIPVSIGVCKLFSCNSKPIHGLLASKRRPIDLQ